ncbi:MAG TPA: hypothetical protein VL860_10335, partial [Planctomycetota bacterium]|nr:hypothetical protein [Planctomycetota bacterium]
AADKAAGGANPGATGLSQFVLIHKNGQVWIKFSCPCGQRLLFPTHKPDRVGRCGRCGREHRVVGLEKRIATFERHLHAAEAAGQPSEEGLLTRLLRPSQYADAAPPELAGPDVTFAAKPPAAPPPLEDFTSFFRSLKEAPPGSAPDVHDTHPATSSVPESASDTRSALAASNLTTAAVQMASSGSGLPADETVDVPPPPPSVKKEAECSVGAAGGVQGSAVPGETGMLTDFDIAPMEPLNSARVRETADLAADRLRPRASQIGESMPSGLIWAWPPATPFARALAGTVDLLAPALGAIVAASVARGLEVSTPVRLGWAYGTLCALGIGWDLAGQLWGSPVSPGKRLAGIHVRTEQGPLPGIGVTAGRSLVKWLATPLLWPLAFLDVQGRALHDRQFGTRVLFGQPRD